MPEEESIGSIIKKKRKEKGLTQEKLGEMIGANKGSISRWENNEITNMGVDKAKELCKVLGLSPLIFIDEKNLVHVEYGELSPAQFKKEVIQLIYRCPCLSSQERQILNSILNTIKEEQ